MIRHHKHGKISCFRIGDYMKIIICVPTHKAEFDIFENIALVQLKKTLSVYDKALVVPNSLRGEFKDDLFSDFKIEAFEDYYFSSARGYNELCVSKVLYERFETYDYMLIYQTDAMIFSDKLEYWCGKGYDYIGAPGLYGIFDSMCAWVGNGGLSLRKISAMLAVLNSQSNILENHPLSSLFHSNEDVFWAYCGANERIGFKVPDVMTAQKFSAQNAINNALYDEELPFGTHYYNTANYDVWYPILTSMGYTLPNPREISSISTKGTDSVNWYRFYQIYEKIVNTPNQHIFDGRKFSIIGAGRYGKECINLLKRMNAHICYVFDNNEEALYGLDYLADLKIQKTSNARDYISNEEIIIAITKVDEEISDLINWILNNGNKSMTYKELFITIEEKIGMN